MRSINRDIWSGQINFVPLNSSRLWTPVSEKAWWDASDTSTITVISNEVRVLAEKTGNSPDLTAFAGFGPATGTHTLNGLNMLYYDGSEAMATYNADYEVPSNGDFAISQLTEVFLPLDNVADGMFAMLDAGGVDWQFIGGVNVNDWNGRLFASELGGGVNVNFSPAMGVGPSIYTLVFNFTESTITAYVSGNVSTPTVVYTIKVTDPQTFIVMSNRVGNALAGHYGETVITDDVSDSKRQKIEGYMAWKWGIESQLPIGHPYKDNPPFQGEDFLLDEDGVTILDENGDPIIAS